MLRLLTSVGCAVVLTGTAFGGPVSQPPQVPLTASMTIGPMVITKPPVRMLVEHETVLQFPITVQLKPLLGGVRSGPVDAFVCATDASGECDPTASPTPATGTVFSGVTSDKPATATLRFTAPTAGAHAKLRLNLCVFKAGGSGKCDQLLASAESEELKVAARYQVAFRDINALAIRSPHSDSLYFAIQAVMAGAPVDCTAATCKQGSPDPTRWPVEAYKPSDPNAGVHQLVQGGIVGPFVLVPDVDQDLIVSFAALNFGAEYTDAERAALKKKITSILGAGITFSQGSTFDVMKRLTNDSNPPKWHGCDGPLAAQVVPVSNHGTSGLATLTSARKPLVLAPDGSGASKIYPSLSGGECSASSYRVTVEVQRLSKP